MTFIKASEKTSFNSAGQFENEKENLLIPTRVKSPIEMWVLLSFSILLDFQSAKNEIEKADSPSTSTSESFEELQTHEKQLPDKTRFNTRGLRAGYANRGTRWVFYFESKKWARFLQRIL